ncbi:RNA polymerase sigma factor [Bacillus sp. SD088]|uniref:RNA polymerase sigma factor n=1 Tax=Bacillus sp. SD088 TaxID=2782012 RepID=UPI003F8D2EC6
MAGKKITPKLLAEAMRTLPKEKRKSVLLYYFFDKSDAEIAELLDIPRSRQALLNG